MLTHKISLDVQPHKVWLHLHDVKNTLIKRELCEKHTHKKRIVLEI